MILSSLIILTISFCGKTQTAPIDDTSLESTDEDAQVEGNNEQNNWSMTQKWLIESINQLKREMNELGHSYEEHVSRQETEEGHAKQSLAHDLAVLRADHTILSQQQQIIIKLLKERSGEKEPLLVQVQERLASPVHLLLPESGEKSQKPQDAKDGEESEDLSHGKHHHRHHRHHSRSNKQLDQLVDREKKFEQNSSQKVHELSEELTALHDISIAMFHEMQDLEKKVEKQSSVWNGMSLWMRTSITSSHFTFLYHTLTQREKSLHPNLFSLILKIMSREVYSNLRKEKINCSE